MDDRNEFIQLYYSPLKCCGVNSQIGVYTLYSSVHQKNTRNEQLLDQIHVPQSPKDKGHMVPKSTLLESGFFVSLYTIIYLCTTRSLQDNTISALF